jgi:hypothetical protein
MSGAKYMCFASNSADHQRVDLHKGCVGAIPDTLLSKACATENPCNNSGLIRFQRDRRTTTVRDAPGWITGTDILPWF